MSGRILTMARAISVLFLLILPLFFLTRVSTPAYAATNDTLNFQARLQKGAGQIAPDGNYNVRFKLYDASTGGSLLWTETRDYNGGAPDNRVRVANGYLSVDLGAITSFPSTIPWDQQLYLTMDIGGTGTSNSWDGEMSPRLSLTAVPYAFNAKTASQLVTTSGALSSTLSIQAPTVGDQTFVIPDQGAAGTYTLLTGAAANGAYIQLQGSTPGTAQTGNLNISGKGIFGSSLAVGTASTTTGTIDLFNSASAYKVSLNIAAQTVANGTVSLPDLAGTSDTFCLVTLANCTGGGGGGANTSLSNIASTNLSAALNVTSGDLNLTTTTSGNIVLDGAGTINLNDSVNINAGAVLGANQTISFTGGNTASRPVSPTEGMLYFDTSTHQLLQYNGTKWVSDRSTATKIVAMGPTTGCTGTTPTASQNYDGADYVASSCTSAQTTINAAIAALPASGGTVYLMEGTYVIDGAITIPANVTFTGSGVGTKLIIADSTATINMVTTSSAGVKITNMMLDGNAANNGSANHQGIYTNVTSTPGVIISDITIQNTRSVAVYANNFNSSTIENSTIKGVTNNSGLYIKGAPNAKIVNNTVTSNSSRGIDSSSTSGLLISGNTVSSNGNMGILAGDKVRQSRITLFQATAR